jgi:hypothetical protein
MANCCIKCGRSMSIIRVADTCGLCLSIPHWHALTPEADGDPSDPKFDVWREWKRAQAKKEKVKS